MKQIIVYLKKKHNLPSINFFFDCLFFLKMDLLKQIILYIEAHLACK